MADQCPPFTAGEDCFSIAQGIEHYVLTAW
jgi:hypothetical protein